MERNIVLKWYCVTCTISKICRLPKKCISAPNVKSRYRSPCSGSREPWQYLLPWLRVNTGEAAPILLLNNFTSTQAMTSALLFELRSILRATVQQTRSIFYKHGTCLLKETKMTSFLILHQMGKRK